MVEACRTLWIWVDAAMSRFFPSLLIVSFENSSSFTNATTIHRDIKRSNLLINHKGEVKVSDFGIIRELESTQAIASTFVGTLTFMSSERICGNA